MSARRWVVWVGCLLVSVAVVWQGYGIADGADAQTARPPQAGDIGLAPAQTATPRPAATATAPAAPLITPTATALPTPTPTPLPTPTAVSPAPQHPPLERPAPDVDAHRRVLTVPILMYHYISVPPPGADKYRIDLSVPPDKFEEQLAWLAENGFSTVSLYALIDHLSTGAPLPPRPVVLTFDDGYRDNYENAFPLLKKYGFTGTFFVVSDFINAGRPEYMTWDMAREMAEAGMSIESHSRTHPDLRGRSFQFLVWEILGPIEAITHYTGQRPRFFCYPAGKYDRDVIAVLKSVDTWAAVTTQPGRRQTLDTAMTWPRLRVHGGGSLRDFIRLVH